MKRVMLFLATNLAVVLVLSVVLNIVYAVTGMQPGSLSGLLVMAAVFGFGGSFISLMMSKGMALRSVGGMVIESLATKQSTGCLRRFAVNHNKWALVCQRLRFTTLRISTRLLQVQNVMIRLLRYQRVCCTT